MECKNCQTHLTDESDYCYSCGGKVIRNRLTMRNLFDDLKENYFNFDNKFLQTFLHLFSKPEVVIDGYIHGTRKKYMDVIAYFALAITVTGIYVFIQKKFFPDAMDFSMLSPEASEQSKMQQKWMANLQEYTSILMMLYVPAYALIAKLTFFGLKKYNYTELLAVFMYIQAQLSFTTSVGMIIAMFIGWKIDLVSFVLLGLMVVYSAYCLKRLYSLSFGALLLRTLIFFGIGIVFYILIIIVVLIIWYFTGDLEAMFEAQKAASKA